MTVTRKQLHEADKEKARQVLQKPNTEPCFICSCGMDEEAPPCCISGCHHVVCRICINEWGKSSNRCPFCRARFSFVYHLEQGEVQEVKFRTRNDVDYDYDVASDQAEVTFSCSICKGSQNIASMVMCSSRDCSYTAHSSCLASERILIGDEDTFKCLAHRGGSAYAELMASSSSHLPDQMAGDSPAQPSLVAHQRAVSAPRRDTPGPEVVVDPFATRRVKKPAFLQQNREVQERPYYLDMHCDEDARTGLTELKRRRTEAAVLRARRDASRPTPVVTTTTFPRLSDSELYNRIYRSTFSSHERRLSAQSAGPTLDSFGNISFQKSQRRISGEALAEQTARRMAEQAAAAAVRARADAERGADAIREERSQFLKQQREAVALEKLRALIASRRVL